MSKPQALNADLNKLRNDATERYHKAVDEALERDILEGSYRIPTVPPLLFDLLI